MTERRRVDRQPPERVAPRAGDACERRKASLAGVDDVDRGVEKVEELGGQVLNGPMEVPGGSRVAQMHVLDLPLLGIFRRRRHARDNQQARACSGC